MLHSYLLQEKKGWCKPALPYLLSKSLHDAWEFCFILNSEHEKCPGFYSWQITAHAEWFSSNKCSVLLFEINIICVHSYCEAITLIVSFTDKDFATLLIFLKKAYLLFHSVVFIYGILVFWCTDAQNRGNLFTKEVAHWINEINVLWMLLINSWT